MRAAYLLDHEARLPPTLRRRAGEATVKRLRYLPLLVVLLLIGSLTGR